MNTVINREIIAVLIRGLLIDVSGRPLTVITESRSSDLPNAMKFELKQCESEASAVIAIRESYNEWKKNFSVDDGSAVLPSCAALKIDGKNEAVFWIGGNLDSARKKLADKDDSPFYAASPCQSAENCASERADVVKNKITLVTGGAQGIGEEISRSLASAGALVFIADLNIEGARKTVAKINECEKRCAAIALEVNVANEESVASMFNAIVQTAGGLDLCISNAGVLKAGSVLEQELSDFKFVTDINYTAFFTICKYAGRLLRTQNLTARNWKTDIIQVNSKSGLEGSNKNAAYSGGKFGSIGLVESFAMELIEYGIKVNAVCPGNFLDGPLWSDPERGLFVQYLKTGKVPGAKTTADVRAFYESKVPMKRGCTGKDLVRAIYYLVEQEYETGQAIPVTGGQIMLH